MGTQWTSKYAILRDLSFAQGRKVPAAIVGSVGIGEKPPAIKIKEDTEEEFFQHCVGDGDVCIKPNYNLIKHMINQVNNNDLVDKECENDTKNGVEISKLNPLSEEFVPKTTGIDANNKEPTGEIANEPSDSNTEIEVKHSVKLPKKRRERNAALMSLLEKEQLLAQTSSANDSVTPLRDQISEQIPEVISNMPSSELKLLKPNDFIIDTNITEAVVKVNEWLQKPVEPQVEKKKSINISPKNMFKKKTPAPLSLENTCMFKRKSDTSSIKSSDSDTVLRSSDNVFVPSNHANEYYKKFVERHQIQEMAQEDIWKRAERLMKEIDAKRLKEKEQTIGVTLDSTLDIEGDNITNNGSRTSLPLNIPGDHTVVLPQHRHDLPEECKVCLALAKYKRQHESTQ